MKITYQIMVGQYHMILTPQYHLNIVSLDVVLNMVVMCGRAKVSIFMILIIKFYLKN